MGTILKLQGHYIALCVTALALFPGEGRAQWSSNPSVNLPVCTASDSQDLYASAADGAGGVFVAWRDFRGGNSDIYAQYLNSAGQPQWDANGKVICNAGLGQNYLDVISDGAGGAIIVWDDQRDFFTTSNDVYAVRMQADGTVAPGWTSGGTLITNASGNQYAPKLTTDGAGGAIIVWQDDRNGNPDLYAMRVNGAGVVGSDSWTAGGRAVCTAANEQGSPFIVASGGGAIILWGDKRTDVTGDIYAVGLTATGGLAPGWTNNGTAVAVAANGQAYHHATSDGAGGILATWSDSRNVATGVDIYAQRLTSAGAVAAGWTANGTVVCNAASNQWFPKIASDGGGGAYVVWEENRNGGVSQTDIYAQRLTSTAGTASGWTANGKIVCDEPSIQGYPVLTSNGSAAVVAWRDPRSGSMDIYALRVPGDGTSDPAWTANGNVVCNDPQSQDGLSIVSDVAGGAILVWRDMRNVSTGSDLYAAHVNASGQLPVAMSGFSVD